MYSSSKQDLDGHDFFCQSKSFLKTLLLLVGLMCLALTKVSAGCEDEPLIPETDRHDVSQEFKTNDAYTYNFNLLFGDKVTVVDYFGHVYVGVKSEDSPVEFADKKLTEVTITVAGVSYVDVGFHLPGTNRFRSFKRHENLHADKETTVTTGMNEQTTSEVLIGAYRRDTDFKVSNMILKFCKEDDCKPDSCMYGGTCIDGINSFTCQCAEGFDGPMCEYNIDECESNPCKYGGTCSDGINDFSCECVTGYSGKACEIAPRCQTIRCISDDCGYTECTLEDTAVITKASLRQSFKNSSCYFYGYPAAGDYLGGDPGYFGYKDNAVWVDNGCKAILEVCY